MTLSRAGSTRDRSRERRRAPVEAPPPGAPPTPRLRRRKEPERSGRGLTGPGAEPPVRARPALRTAEVRPPDGPCRPRAERLPALSDPGPGPGLAWAYPLARAFPRPVSSPAFSARSEPTGGPGRGRFPGAAEGFGAEARGVRRPEGTHRSARGLVGTCIHFVKSRGAARLAQGPAAHTLEARRVPCPQARV